MMPATGATQLQHHSGVAGGMLTSAPTKEAWLWPKYRPLANIQDASSIQQKEGERKKLQTLFKWVYIFPFLLLGWL